MNKNQSTTNNQYFPKQQGAWAMVILPGLIPFFAIKSFNWIAVSLFFASLLIFVAHHNFAQNIKYLRRRAAPNFKQLWFGLTLTLSSIIIGVCAMVQNLPTLWVFGAIAVVLSCVHFLLIYFRKEMTVIGEMVGVAGLTLTSPMIVYSLLNVCNEYLYGLWFFNIVYFSGTIFYVKLKVRLQPNISKSTPLWKRIRIGQQVIIHLLLMIGLVFWMIKGEILPKLSFIAMIPTIIKTIFGVSNIRDRKIFNIRSIGFSELRHAIGFTILIVLSYHIA